MYEKIPSYDNVQIFYINKKYQRGSDFSSNIDCPRHGNQRGSPGIMNFMFYMLGEGQCNTVTLMDSRGGGGTHARSSSNCTRMDKVTS